MLELTSFLWYNSHKGVVMSLLKVVLSAYDIYSDKKYKRSQFKHALVDIKHNIVYNPAAEDICHLSIYKNKTGIRHGTIVNIHGGALISYAPRTRKSFCLYLANKGFTVINVNYGLSPKYTIVDQLSHCNTALKWIADNANQLSIDKNNIHITGDGVGAWLARNLVHLTANQYISSHIENEIHPITFATCAYFCGSFDLANVIDKNKKPKLHNYIQRKLKPSIMLEDDKPLVSLDATQLDLAYKLPTYILHTAHDIVPQGQSAKLVQQVLGYGSVVWEFKAIKHKAEHNFQLNTTNTFSEHAIQSYLRFLQEYNSGRMQTRYIEI